MNGLDWQWPLSAGETLRWQGRPAPRCFVWRNWKQAAVGTMLFLASSFWLMLAYELFKKDGSPWWLLLIPVPLVLLSLWFGPINLLLTRIRWEKVFYAVTEQRLLVRDGQFKARFASFPLDEIEGWQQKKYGAQLIGLRLQLRNRPPVILHCIEQPQNLFECLQCELTPSTTKESV